jgi:hypothetical protein
MSDLIERAEFMVYDNYPSPHLAIVGELLSALKAERAQRYNARALSEDVVCHVLADIDQICDDDSWSLHQRLETIQKICDGSEYGK